MSGVNFGPAPSGTVEQKVDWLIASLRKIEIFSNQIDAMKIADAFTVSNVTGTRIIDAAAATAAEVRDALATLLGDLKSRGSKRT